jgi:ABC-2 type transport system permease protein
MRRLIVITQSLLLINLRHPAVLFWNFAFPVGLLVLNSLIWGRQDLDQGATAAWLTAGVIVLNIMAGAFMGDAGWLVQMRDQGILQRIQATPLPAAVLVLAYTAVRLMLVLLQAGLITAVAALALGAQFAPGGLLWAAALALVGTLAFVLLGQAIAAVAPSVGAATMIGQVIYFPLMFISDLFIPISQMPAWMADLARWTPAFMLVDLMRPALVGVPALQPGWVNLLGLALFGAAGLLIAGRWFRWEPWR